MKTLLLFASGMLIALLSTAQPNSINTKTDYVEYGDGQTYPDANSITFSGKQARYDSVLFNYGLHFKNNVTNTVTKNFGINDVNSGSLIGVHGQNTVVKYSGNFYGNQGNTYSHMLLTNGGRFVVEAGAKINLILFGSMYTRQIWIWGDGTGVFELEEGFIADRTDGGTKADAMGSLRFFDATILSHHSQNLPVYMRNDEINSHFVVDGGEKSKWVVATNNQEFVGGVWMEKGDLTIETQMNLLMSGERQISNAGGYEYINWGGLMMGNDCGDIKQPRTLYKTGDSTLTLSGANGFDVGSKIKVVEGTLEFQSDPFSNEENLGYEIAFHCLSTWTVEDQNLILEVEDDATLVFNTPKARIDSLAMAPNATLRIGLNDTLDAKKLVLDGNLEVVFPDDVVINEGDEFQVMPSGIASGNFKQIDILNYSGPVTWDTSKLLTEGVLKVASLTEASNVTKEAKNIKVYPSVTSSILNVSGAAGAQMHLMNAIGLEQGTYDLDEQTQINISNLHQGVYIYSVVKSGQIMKSGKIMKQ